MICNHSYISTFFALSILCLLTLTSAQSRGLRKYNPRGAQSFERTVPITRHRKQIVEEPKNHVEEDQPLTEEERRQKEEDAIIARVGSFAFLKIGNSLVYNRGVIPKSLFDGVPMIDWLGPMANHSMEVSSEEMGAPDSNEDNNLANETTIDSLAIAETTVAVTDQPETPTTKTAKKTSFFYYSLGDRHFNYYNDRASKTKYVHQHHSSKFAV